VERATKLEFWIAGPYMTWQLGRVLKVSAMR